MRIPSVSQELQATHEIVNLLEESKANTESIIDNLPDIFLIINQTGRIFKGNRTSLKIFDVVGSKLLEKKLPDLFKGTAWHSFLDQFDALDGLENAKNGVEFELPIYLSNCEERSIIWHLRKLELSAGSKNALYCVIGRDISISVLLSKKNQQLQTQKQRIQSILDNSLQGFFTFNEELQVESDYSTQVEQLLGKDILGKNIGSILNFDASIKNNLSIIFFNEKNFAVFRTLRPMELNIQERALKFEFVPIMDGGKICRVLCSVTDVTPLKILEKRAEKSAKTAQILVKVLNSKSMFQDLMRSIYHPEGEFKGSPDEKSVRRFVHTIKGSFGFFEFQEVVDICGIWEARWAEGKVQIELKPILDELRTVLDRFQTSYSQVLKLDDNKNTELAISFQRIERVIDEALKADVTTEMLHSIEAMLESMPDSHLSWLDEAWMMLAAKQSKLVERIKWRNSTPLIFEVYKNLFLTLIHVVRNTVDHGIESPQERVKSNKPKQGSLSMELQLKDGVYHLHIEDDGKGPKFDKIRAKAEKLLLPVPSTDEEALDLLFQSSFSTEGKIGDVSGAGVGLDAVRTEAIKLGGYAKAISSPSGFHIHIWFNKLTLSEIHAMKVFKLS